MDFTKNQKLAIDHLESNLQIIACAGSGKTRVLVEKICKILQDKTEITPENIIAFTFTEKAASELKNRIDKAVKEKGIVKIGMADMYVGTIHGYCLDFLQQQCMKYQKYSILNPIQTKLFVQKHDKEFLKVDIKTIGNANSNLHLPSHTSEYLEGIAMIREEGLRNNSSLPQVWKEAFDRYNELFHQFCYFDFSMIIDTAVAELQTPEMKAYIQENIKHLVVDEYQDLNPLQEKLLSIFYDYGVNICVVGDDDQTIYQWRGSNTNNFIEYPQRYNLSDNDIIFLDTNFRSTSKIIEVASDIISANDSRVPKEFKSGNKELVYQKNHDLFFKEFNSYEDEAEFIAEEISKLLSGGMQASEIAILTRKKIFNKPLLDALQKKNIPVIVEGVAELFDQPIVKASEHIFHYLSEKTDRDTLQYLWQESVPELDENNIIKAIDSIDKLSKKITTQKAPLNFQQIYRDFLNTLEIQNLPEIKETETRLYNLGQFSVLLADFEKIHFSTYSKRKLYYFGAFIQYMAEGNYSEGELLNMYTKPNAVQIMTIHKSKGLEFGAVFVPGMSRNAFPPKGKGGRGVHHYLDIKGLIDGGERYLKGEVDDERRLFYVAITRSKKFLFLTRSSTYLNTTGGINQRDYKNRSEFLQEALDIPSGSPFIQTTPDSYEIPEDFKKEKSEASTIVNFSLLSGYFDCPYLFKIDNFYQFQNVMQNNMGYGKSMHDMIKEIHIEGSKGKVYTHADLSEIMERHFHMPYADSSAIERLKKACLNALETYVDKYGQTFKDIEFVEQKIEIPLTDDLLVTGRIDLIKNKDGSVDIIDFKTSDDIPNTKEQVMIYALGYEHLTGRKPDMYKVYNVDDNKMVTQDAILLKDMEAMKNRIVDAMDNIKNNNLPKCADKTKCAKCHKKELCSGAK